MNKQLTDKEKKDIDIAGGQMTDLARLFPVIIKIKSKAEERGENRILKMIRQMKYPELNHLVKKLNEDRRNRKQTSREG